MKIKPPKQVRVELDAALASELRPLERRRGLADAAGMALMYFDILQSDHYQAALRERDETRDESRAPRKSSAKPGRKAPNGNGRNGRNGQIRRGKRP